MRNSAVVVQESFVWSTACTGWPTVIEKYIGRRGEEEREERGGEEEEKEEDEEEEKEKEDDKKRRIRKERREGGLIDLALLYLRRELEHFGRRIVSEHFKERREK
jgi:TATA-binding protein-associated factor Taf7